MNKLVCIIDDEPDIVELVAHHLKKTGFTVKSYNDGLSFCADLKKGTAPDLIVLDLMLPGMDGIEICKTIRSNEHTRSIPIVMLTAKTEETDRVLGLELGADDYISKPFSPRELVARVKAVLRRGSPEETNRVIDIRGYFTIDQDRCVVKAQEKTIALTATEFKILTLLASCRGRVFSRDAILDHLWGDEKAVVDRTIDVHVRHLREKLGEQASSVIQNVRGMGYKLKEE